MGLKEIFGRIVNKFTGERGSPPGFVFPWDLPVSHATNWRYADYAKEGYKKNVYVYGCIREIEYSASKLKFSYLVNGEKVEDDKLPPSLAPLKTLFDRPNDSESLPEFLKKFVMHLYVGGSAYIHVNNIESDEIGGRERIRKGELKLIRPDRVEVKHLGGEIVGFNIDQKHMIPPEEILFFRFADPLDDFAGLSPIEVASLIIDTHNDGSNWNRNLLKNFGLISGVFTLKGVRYLDPEQRKELEKEFKSRFGGSDNIGKTLFVGGDGADYHPFAKTPTELDWLEGDKSLGRKICATFGVPSTLLNDPEMGTYANKKEARRELYTDTVLPIMEYFVEEINTHLLSKVKQYNVELQIETDHIDALRDDEDAKYTRIAQADWMTINEKRATFDLPDIPGGDVVLVPFNLIPTTSIGKLGDGRSEIEMGGVRALNAGDSKILPYVHPRSLYPTEELRRFSSQKFQARSDKWERVWKRELDKYFDELGNQFVKDFSDTYGEQLSSPDPLEHRNVPEEYSSNWMTNEGVEFTLRSILEDIQISTVIDFGQSAIEELLGDGTLFNIEFPDLRNWLADDLATRSHLITQSTANKIQNIINPAVAEGQGADKIADALRDYFTDISDARTASIARTEVNRASNKATLTSYEQVGVDEKEWISARDKVVRDTHFGLDGQVVPVTEMFISGSGGRAEAPGFFGIPEEDINCRCNMAPLRPGETPI